MLGLIIGLVGAYFMVTNAEEFGLDFLVSEKEIAEELEEEPVEEEQEEDEEVAEVVEGYVYNPEFKSVEGPLSSIALSDEFVTMVDDIGGSVNNFSIPYSMDDPSEVYLAVEFEDEEESNFKTKIYSYNLESTEYGQVFEYVSTNAEAPSHLRPLATDGSKMVVLREVVDNSPGPCTSPWSAGEVLYFDLDDDERELFVYEVPEEVQNLVDRETQQCKYLQGLSS